MKLHCTLCQNPQTSVFQDPLFFKCQHCGLIFKDHTTYLNPQEEKERYNMHENHIEDPAYVKFLWPVVEQIKKIKAPMAQGLDYGCGPNPVLSQLLVRENYKMQFYDPYFFPMDLNALEKLDFITCTEAAEHFYHPGSEFKKIFSLLKSNGTLVLMTDLFQKNIILKNWHYTRDPSHVCFFSEQSLTWLAGQSKIKVKIESTRLAIFTM